MGFKCPRCDYAGSWKQSRYRYLCQKCRHQTTLIAGTIFQGTHLSLRLWLRAIGWVVNQKKGISDLGLQKDLGLGSYRTAWLRTQPHGCSCSVSGGRGHPRSWTTWKDSSQVGAIEIMGRNINFYKRKYLVRVSLIYRWFPILSAVSKRGLSAHPKNQVTGPRG